MFLSLAEGDLRLELGFPVTGQPPDQKEALAQWAAGSLLVCC